MEQGKDIPGTLKKRPVHRSSGGVERGRVDHCTAAWILGSLQYRIPCTTANGKGWKSLLTLSGCDHGEFGEALYISLLLGANDEVKPRLRIDSHRGGWLWRVLRA